VKEEPSPTDAYVYSDEVMCAFSLV